MNAPVPTPCQRCEDSGVVGTVTVSHCPDCRCIGCGAKVPGLCNDCAGDDWLNHEIKEAGL